MGVFDSHWYEAISRVSELESASYRQNVLFREKARRIATRILVSSSIEIAPVSNVLQVLKESNERAYGDVVQTLVSAKLQLISQTESSKK